jgi:3',5'-cyclic AMP phosphodiesterase CpdA
VSADPTGGNPGSTVGCGAAVGGPARADLAALIACLGAVLATPAVAQAEGARMLKGPYLQNLAPRSITVMWHVDEAAPARIVIDGPGGTREIPVGAARIAEATLDQLTPASRYRYRVEIAGEAWHGEFATAPEVGADVPFSFLVMGDTRSGTESHRRVVERMAQEVPDFVVGTGDMVDDGSQQDQWQQFFDVEHRLLRDNAFFPAVGNHDRQGRGRTADSYRAFFSVPDNGGDSERYYAFSYAAARFLVLDSNEYSFALSDQTAWLERELIAARQDPSVRHVFAVMHHPPFSISVHGGAVDLRERWTPLFEKYQVSAVFSGHDHVYERAEHNGIRYFVSGGGGAPLYPRQPSPHPIDAAAVKRFERVFHYLRVTVTGSHVEVAGIRTDGSVIETTTWSDAPASPAIVAAHRAPSPAAGAASPVRPPAPAAMTGGVLVWIGLGAMGLLLAAAVVVARTLRR